MGSMKKKIFDDQIKYKMLLLLVYIFEEFSEILIKFLYNKSPLPDGLTMIDAIDYYSRQLMHTRLRGD